MEFNWCLNISYRRGHTHIRRSTGYKPVQDNDCQAHTRLLTPFLIVKLSTLMASLHSQPHCLLGAPRAFCTFFVTWRTHHMYRISGGPRPTHHMYRISRGPHPTHHMYRISGGPRPTHHMYRISRGPRPIHHMYRISRGPRPTHHMYLSFLVSC